VTRFVVDCGAHLHLAGEEIEVPALAQLQADALVTLDAELARRVEGLVPTAPIEALTA
jgi:hypothetical protein